MKLITEEIETAKVLVEEKDGKKSMYIEGVFLQGNLKNRNNRMYPVEILERGGVYLPDRVSVEFQKEDNQRPKVIVYETDKNKKRKLLELKLVMVAEQ